MPVGLQDAEAALRVSAAAAFAGDATQPVGVAVSGGSDSVALLHLLVQAGWPVRAVTVDHRLRAEAAEEAAFVADLCEGLGVPHQVLVWQDHPPGGNLQDQARRARYALIANWARSLKLDEVAIGHTADDQAETFLMELARGAGLDGLSGMRPVWQQDGIRFRRPLLSHARQQLRDWLTRQGIGWIDDPSNDNDRFTRVKARRALRGLEPLGLTPAKLGAVARNLAAVQAAVDLAVADAADRVAEEEAGAILLDRTALGQLPAEIARRLLIAALRAVSGAEYPPRADAVARVIAAIAAQRDVTLHGCCLRVTERGVHILREPRAVRSLVCAPEALWDGRWRVEGRSSPGLEVRALGAIGLRQCSDWRGTGLGREALIVTPAVWRGPALIAAPAAGLPNGWTARIVAPLARFIIPH